MCKTLCLLKAEGKILRMNFSFNWKCFYLTDEQDLWFGGEYFIFARVLYNLFDSCCEKEIGGDEDVNVVLKAKFEAIVAKSH